MLPMIGARKREERSERWMSAKQNKFCAFGPYSSFMPRMYFINIILILYLRDSKSGTTHALPHAAMVLPPHRFDLL